MKPKSKRNRHTGHINAFKAGVIAKGEKFTVRGHVYYRALINWVVNKKGFRISGGYCIVKTK